MTEIKKNLFQRKKRISDSDHVTVMFIKGAEKLRSFSISAPFLFGALIFFAVYVTLSIIFINLYFSEIRAGRSQSQRLIQLQEQIKDTRASLEGAKDRPGSPQQVAPSGETDADDSPAAGQDMDWVRQGGSSLDVQRFSAKKGHQQLMIRFRLVNIDPDTRSISGYVIMIAVNSEEPPRYWTYPKLALKNGVPVNFEACPPYFWRNGEYFKIRNYRTVRGRYAIGNDELPPTFIRILAYNESGLLIMKKEVALDE